MDSRKYPNNACCYDVSWDNVVRTGVLCVVQNLLFLIVWVWDLQILTILSNLIIFYIIYISGKKLFLNNDSQSETSTNYIGIYTRLFEFSYETINGTFDWFRKNSQGSRGALLVLFLYVIQLFNISLFGFAWIISTWSYAEPALFKFLGLNLRELYFQYKENNILTEKVQEVLSLIPRSSSVKKSS